MNIVIFSGGSGSDAIQRGIYNEYPEANVSVITNGFDNGKSTGLIRTVFDGKILGPSDIRKNQLRYLSYTNKSLADILDFRFTSDKPEELILEKLSKYSFSEFFKAIITRYFLNPKAHEITYEDFSIGNIIYGQLAHENDNSMQKAADILAEKLGIKTDVIVNSDESLFLYAKTASNKYINDEADIVDYNRSDDRISSIGFYDADNKHQNKSIMCKRACDAVESADMIIFSSGTQWSSLIPTYQSLTYDGRNFSELIDNVKVSKYLVMNTYPDSDMIGVSSTEIQKLVNDYFDMTKVTTVIDNSADVILRESCEDFPHIRSNLSFGGKHFPAELINLIMKDHFKYPEKDDVFVFDWDDTIVARQGKNTEVSDLNRSIIGCLNSIVISGNTHHHISHNRVWADGGINYYVNGKFKKTVNKDLLIDDVSGIIEMLTKLGFNKSMIKDRAGACISIKPVDVKYRHALTETINMKLPENLIAKVSGRTTIDIMNKETDKIFAFEEIIKENKKKNIFYIGDEPNGNDKTIFEKADSLAINTIHVKSVIDTQIFLKVLDV